jgi:hypothetical protein
MPRKLDQQIGSLQEKKADVERKIAELSRKLDTRYKILTGSVALTHAKGNRNYAQELCALLERYLAPKDKKSLKGLREKLGLPPAKA